jgi:acyl-CoA synthetase (AMP-forming)/AMP-acid ligase II
MPRSPNRQKSASLTSPVDIDMDDDPREQISELEEQIEELAGALERCRKIALASQVAMACGGILLAATILGIITFDPMAMVAGLAALLGGVVVVGSNTSTANQLSESMRNAEALRAALIGRLDIRLVEDTSANRHLGKYH